MEWAFFGALFPVGSSLTGKLAAGQSVNDAQ